MILPFKLNRGNEIRVISPSTSLAVITNEQREQARSVIEKMGFSVTFSKHAEECDDFFSSQVQSRVEDLHEAFLDSSVKGILTSLGGFNSNQLLRYIDYDLIRAHPKIICGYSDITVLCNAINQKTGLVTYSGPTFSNFAMKKGFSYTKDYFQACLMEEEPIVLCPSNEWSDDAWYRDQDHRIFLRNEGPVVIQEGECEGRIVGGNLCTLNLLQGTEFMPDLKSSVLLIEDDNLVNPQIFDRDLQSLLHMPAASGIQGIVIGRFQKKSNMTTKLLRQIMLTKEELRHIPILANVNFGHTSPIITFPIGGYIKIAAYHNHRRMELVTH